MKLKLEMEAQKLDIPGVDQEEPDGEQNLRKDYSVIFTKRLLEMKLLLNMLV